jgi:hypothetical protein
MLISFINSSDDPKTLSNANPTDSEATAAFPRPEKTCVTTPERSCGSGPRSRSSANSLFKFSVPPRPRRNQDGARYQSFKVLGVMAAHDDL